MGGDLLEARPSSGRARGSRRRTRRSTAGSPRAARPPRWCAAARRAATGRPPPRCGRCLPSTRSRGRGAARQCLGLVNDAADTGAVEAVLLEHLPGDAEQLVPGLARAVREQEVRFGTSTAYAAADRVWGGRPARRLTPVSVRVHDRPMQSPERGSWSPRNRVSRPARRPEGSGWPAG